MQTLIKKMKKILNCDRCLKIYRRYKLNVVYLHTLGDTSNNELTNNCSCTESLKNNTEVSLVYSFDIILINENNVPKFILFNTAQNVCN